MKRSSRAGGKPYTRHQYHNTPHRQGPVKSSHAMPTLGIKIPVLQIGIASAILVSLWSTSFAFGLVGRPQEVLALAPASVPYAVGSYGYGYYRPEPNPSLRYPPRPTVVYGYGYTSRPPQPVPAPRPTSTARPSQWYGYGYNNLNLRQSVPAVGYGYGYRGPTVKPPRSTSSPIPSVMPTARPTAGYGYGYATGWQRPPITPPTSGSKAQPGYGYGYRAVSIQPVVVPAIANRAAVKPRWSNFFSFLKFFLSQPSTAP
jgi:hypothetical protein